MYSLIISKSTHVQHFATNSLCERRGKVGSKNGGDKKKKQVKKNQKSKSKTKTRKENAYYLCTRIKEKTLNKLCLFENCTKQTLHTSARKKTSENGMKLSSSERIKKLTVN